MQIKSKSRRPFWLVAASVGLIGVAVLASKVILSQVLVPTNNQTTPIVAQPKIEPVGLTSKIMFTGNVFWGRYINDWSMKSDLKYAYPFSRLHEFGRENYDAWIGGLECPTSPRINMTSAEMEANLQFNCRPEYLPEAAKWFNIFSLANNHTDNQGGVGFAETQQELDKVGIQYFGHYEPRQIDDNCEIVALPVTVKKSDNTTSKGQLPVAMCGFHGVFRIPPLESLQVMQKYTEYLPVFVMPQSGAEYKPAPDQIKTNSYRQMIDNGADAIMGDHPHWVQNTEAYKGKLIVYSMGNFMFDQQLRPETTRSAAIVVEIEAEPSQPKLNDWLKLGPSCQKFKDDCLAQIKAKQLPKLQLKYTFSIVGTDNYDKIVRPATPEQTAAILQRLNWNKTIQELSPPYFGK